MKPLTREWIDKAEGDLRTAERELAAEEHPNYDVTELADSFRRRFEPERWLT